MYARICIATERNVRATASFIINIDTLYICKDTYVIAVGIARALNSAGVNIPEEKMQQTYL